MLIDYSNVLKLSKIAIFKETYALEMQFAPLLSFLIFKSKNIKKSTIFKCAKQIMI